MGSFVAPILLLILLLIIIFFIVGTLLILIGAIILISKRIKKKRMQSFDNEINHQHFKPVKKAVNVMAVIFIIVGIIFCIP